MRFCPAFFRGIWGRNRLLYRFFSLPMVEIDRIRVYNGTGIMPKLSGARDTLTGRFLKSNTAALCHGVYASNSKDMTLDVRRQVRAVPLCYFEATRNSWILLLSLSSTKMEPLSLAATLIGTLIWSGPVPLLPNEPTYFPFGANFRTQLFFPSAT